MAIAKRESNDGAPEKYRIIEKTPDALFISYENGGTELKKRNATNELLYIEQMYDFLRSSGNIRVLRTEEEGGYLAIAPTEEDDIFTLWVDSSNQPITTRIDDAKSVLEGVVDALNGDYEALEEVYFTYIEDRARPNVVNLLEDSLPVETTEEGWIVEDNFLVTWEAEIYRSVEDKEGESFRRSGSDVRSVDSRQAISLNKSSALLAKQDNFNAESIRVEGMGTKFTEMEIEFLATVVWLLKRREHINDNTFWEQFEEQRTPWWEQ